MAERQSGGIERGKEAIENAAGERSAELLKNLEKAERYDDHESKHSAEKARVEAQSEALFSKEYSTESKQGTIDSAPPMPASKKQREQAYKQTMQHIQSEMNPVERGFSKVIHNPIVERVSDIAGSTIARPNSILMGSVFAFVGVLAVYLYAKHTGFALTGFETIAAFVGGWLLGILIDFVRAAFGKR